MNEFDLVNKKSSWWVKVYIACAIMDGLSVLYQGLSGHLGISDIIYLLIQIVTCVFLWQYSQTVDFAYNTAEPMRYLDRACVAQAKYFKFTGMIALIGIIPLVLLLVILPNM